MTRVYVGMRNWHPYIADVIAQMRSRRRDTHQGGVSGSAEFADQRWAVPAGGAGGRDGDRGGVCRGMGGESAAGEAFAEKLRPVWAEACAESGRRVPVLFTAHSVPCRTIMTGEASVAGARPGTPVQISPDPYPVEAKRTAELVADRMAAAGFGDSDWFFAFQSQGVSGGPWIGPTVEETLKAIQDEGHVGVVMQPVGFLCDHVEILYDIDIAFRETAGAGSEAVAGREPE